VAESGCSLSDVAHCCAIARQKPDCVFIVGSWTFSESNTLVRYPTLNPCEVSDVPLTISADTFGITTDTVNGGWGGHFGTTGVEACSVNGADPQPNPYQYVDYNLAITRIGDSVLLRSTSNKHLYEGVVVTANRLSGTVDTGTGRSGTWAAVRVTGQ
jgi:hypothetical protein